MLPADKSGLEGRLSVEWATAACGAEIVGR